MEFVSILGGVLIAALGAGLALALRRGRTARAVEGPVAKEVLAALADGPKTGRQLTGYCAGAIQGFPPGGLGDAIVGSVLGRLIDARQIKKVVRVGSAQYRLP